jgi:hypothetical protein
VKLVYYYRPTLKGEEALVQGIETAFIPSYIHPQYVDGKTVIIYAGLLD